MKDGQRVDGPRPVGGTLGWRAAAICVVAAGCTGGPSPGASPEAPASEMRPTSGTATPTAAVREMEESPETSEKLTVEPVYPSGSTPPDPGAQRLCRALHEAPARARAACCGRPPPTTAVDGRMSLECVRLLSHALAAGAVRLDTAQVEACEKATTIADAPTSAACGHLGRFTKPPPEPCRRAVVGTRGAGATCRSHLECEGSLQCMGVGPAQAGRCAGPRPVGAPCDTSVDVLATHTRQTDASQRHPECEGACLMHRCAPYAVDGAACASNLHCGPGRACIEARCADAPTGLPAGSKCPSLGCAPGLVCAAGKCVVPAAAGTPCQTDFECQGACLKKALLDKQGVCGPFCE